MSLQSTSKDLTLSISSIRLWLFLWIQTDFTMERPIEQQPRDHEDLLPIEEEDEIINKQKQPQFPSSTLPPTKKPHVCEVCITFPTNLQAEHAWNVLRVDQEPPNRMTKTMEVIWIDSK